MGSAGLGQVFIILFIFLVLLLANFLSVGLKKIEENWEHYKCNPLVLPFAGLVGKDPTENFAECIKNMQIDYMAILMQPIDLNFSMLGEIASSITKSMSEMFTFMDSFRDMIGNITAGIFGAFSGILGGFTLTMLSVRDIVSRLMAVVFLTVYSMNSLLLGGRALWAGGPGQLVRAVAELCFSPETRIPLEGGGTLPIAQCVPGTILKHGIRVRAIMEIDNRDGNGGHVEDMYEYSGGFVSGTHLVYHKEANQFVQAKRHPGVAFRPTKNFDTLYCLITSNHLIPSGELLFHDWEDNTGPTGESAASHCLL